MPKSITNTRIDICHKCGHDVTWSACVVLVKRHNKLQMGYICSECGTMVPEFAFSNYLKTGEIVIPAKV